MGILYQFAAVVGLILGLIAFRRSRRAERERKAFSTEIKELKGKLTRLEARVNVIAQAARPKEGPAVDRTASAEEAGDAEASQGEGPAADLTAAMDKPTSPAPVEGPWYPPEQGPAQVEAPVIPEEMEEPIRVSRHADLAGTDAEEMSQPEPARLEIEGVTAKTTTAPGPVGKLADVPSIPKHEPAPPPKRPPERPVKKPVRAPRPPRLQRLRAKLASRGMFKDVRETDWETQIGRNWLNIIGIVVLVVGLVLLIQQSMLYLGPAGKIGLGLGVSALLVAGGLFQERRERYRVFARTLVGGGWALLYFTVFAAYNIEVARVIDNSTLALVALCLVAAAIILHSFKYRSEFVTGLAYGLGFLAIHLSPISFYSLVAVAILAVSLLFVIRVADWRTLGLLSVFATYASHARWLVDVDNVATAGSADLLLSGLSPEQAFLANLGLVVFYWLVFCVVAIVRPPHDRKARLTDIGTTLANTAGLLALASWQVIERTPGHLHELYAGAVVAFVAVAVVDAFRKREVLAQFNGTVAVVLYAVVLPLALEPTNADETWLAAYWAVGSAVVWGVGQRWKRWLFRVEAYGLAVFALGAALFSNFVGPIGEQGTLAWALGLPVLLLYEAFEERLNGSKGRKTAVDYDRLFGVAAIPAAAVLVGFATWSVVGNAVAGLLWSFIAILLVEFGGRLSRLHLRIQGYLLGAAGFVAAAQVNLLAGMSIDTLPGWALALTTSAVFYVVTARLIWAAWARTARERALATVPAAFATFLFAWAAMNALANEVAFLVWIAWALLLQETGGRSRDGGLRAQGHALAIVSFLGLAGVLVGAMGTDGDVPAWVWALMALALFYAVTARLLFAGWTLERHEIALRSGPSGLATVLYALVVLAALPLEIALVAMAGWAVVLLEFGGRQGVRAIRLQAYALGLLPFVGFAVYYMQLVSFEGAVASWVATLAAAGLFYLASVRLFFARWELSALETGAAAVPAALATILYALGTFDLLPLGAICVAWIGWAVLLDEFARTARKRHMSEIGLGLAAAAFVIGVLVNVYGLWYPVAPRVLPNWLALGLTTAGLYWLHTRMRADLLTRAGGAVVETRIVLHAATLLLVLLAWRELPSVGVALAWAGLALGLFELSGWSGEPALRHQSHVILVAVFGRLFMANFITPGEALGLSHRLITVVPVIATLYYIRLRILALMPKEAMRPTRLFRLRERDSAASLYAWAAAVLLVVLARFEVGGAYAVAAWAPIFVVLYWIGLRSDVRDFRFQSYLLALLIFARSWSTNAYLEGALFGMPERIATILPAIAALLCAVVISEAQGAREMPQSASRLVRFLHSFDRHARPGFAILFSVLLGLLIFYQMSIALVSIGWTLEALLLFVLGFALKERSFRLLGLGLLLVCLLKVTFFDLQGVEAIFRILSFIILGVILLLVSLGYSRYRDLLRRYL